jgi:hypothetical protein
MFIPTGVDENNPSLHHEIVQHDLAMQDIRERLFVNDRAIGRITSTNDWYLVFCMTEEQLERRTLELKQLAERYKTKAGNWVPIIYEASTTDDASASRS